MPPSKVCPQCQTIVHARQKVCKSCQHVFRTKRKAEQNLPDQAMKRVRVSQSDSVKSAMKAKNKLQKSTKRASETREQTLQRQQQSRKHMASLRASETSDCAVRRGFALQCFLVVQYYLFFSFKHHWPFTGNFAFSIIASSVVLICSWVVFWPPTLFTKCGKKPSKSK